MSPAPPSRRPWARWVVVMLASALLHVGAIGLLSLYGLSWSVHAVERPVGVTILQGEALPGEALPPSYELLAEAPPERTLPEEEVPEPEPEPEPELPSGQIVDTPPPKEEKIPLQSDYLAAHNNAVPEESQARKFKINPEVLASMYSESTRYQLDEVPDVGASEVSTGARAGGQDSELSGKGAPRSSIPSQFAITNKEGLAAPTSSTSRYQEVLGAPQNDKLTEKYGAFVALNTREFYGADYMNRIRSQVNFYWSQNLDNLSPSVRLGKPRYLTRVSVVLNADGVLESIEVTLDSGTPAIDDCVVQAFKIAGPYPNPPVQLIAADNRVYLPNFDWEVLVGQAQMQYQGVDPRANVQFPGILNAPR